MAESTVKAAEGVSNCYDAIAELFTELKNFTARLNVHVLHDFPPDLHQIFVKIFVSLLSVCELSAKLIKDGRVMKYFKVSLLSRDEAIQEELAKLRRLTEEEHRVVSTLALSVTKTTQNTVNDIRTGLTHVGTSIDQLNESMASLQVAMNGTHN